MRNITEESIYAFLNAEKFNKSNMQVSVLPNVTELKLHGNTIAYKYNDPQNTLLVTDAGWDTNTTKERLNGLLNVSVRKNKGVWYLNGLQWDGSLVQPTEDGYIQPTI